MVKLFISTERLIITEFDEQMAEVVHLNSLDDDNRRFVPDEVFQTVEEAHDTISFLMQCYGGKTGPFVFPVLLKSGENIGYVQAVPIGTEWEVGYHIAEEHTGQGYATEALNAFMPKIADQLGIERIWGICRGDNLASRRVLEKCSFRLEHSCVGKYKGETHKIYKYLYEF